MHLEDNTQEKVFQLKGEGADTWFVWKNDNSLPPHHYRFIRQNPEGEPECDNVFVDNTRKFNPHKPFQITYISHCKKIMILQNGQKIELRKKE
jgi:hypothetical protein